MECITFEILIAAAATASPDSSHNRVQHGRGERIQRIRKLKGWAEGAACHARMHMHPGDASQECVQCKKSFEDPLPLN